MHTIKTRIAPSPTGFIHLGTVRTALFNVLFARHNKGTFLLRIEDTDRERSREEYNLAMQEDLRWLGLDWQEGPFKQSERQAIYDRYYRILEEQNLAYPCFCSEEQLALARKVALSAGRPPRYPENCRRLTTEQKRQKTAVGIKPTLRFAIPPDQKIGFYDLVYGEQQFDSNDLGDFVIRRADGTAPFLFCNAIDDALMHITHVLRGEDHLTNTPRQLLILRALQLQAPQYGHLPLIMGPDGTPLSKRHGSRSIPELRAEGYLPEAILNYLARLGHHYTNDAWMTLSELTANFTLSSLGKSPAKFDLNQLLYWQKETLSHMDIDKLWEWLGARVQALVPDHARFDFLATVRSNIIFPKDAEHWAKIFFTDELSFNAEGQNILQNTDPRFFTTALEVMNTENGNFQKVNEVISRELNIKGKALFQPLRLALTGELHGPEMAKIIYLLGKEKVRQRLENVKKKV
jgi:glutamyl-tRNA synthetase